ncbi:MAG: hypothetical protein DHS20C07_29310 [Methyloligella sp.]|nr:MAG: hypothetical protein DHS20C07_29310 [Methyloligella sp.]
MFKWLKNRAEKRQNAKNLFLLASEQSLHPHFYHAYQVTDSVLGRYEMLCIHICLVLERLRHEDNEKQISELLTEILVEELELHYKEAAPKDASETEKINKLIAGFYERSADYQKGLRLGKKQKIMKALSHHIFQSMNSGDERSNDLSNYMIAVHNYLNSVPFHDIETANFTFVEP